MNNMSSIDSNVFGDRWDIKRKFLERYKFTLALESDVATGYQTEKLYDAMRSYSMPIYVGDPTIENLFDVNTMICESNNVDVQHWIKIIEDFAQLRFSEISGANRMRPSVRVKRKLRPLLRDIRLKKLMTKYADSLAESIVAMDKDDNAYLRSLATPYLHGNVVQRETFTDEFWVKIFNQALTNRA